MPPTIDAFTGEESFSTSPESLFAALTDPDSLALAVPDRVSHTRIDDRTLKCVVRPGFSFIRANMQLTFSIVNAVPNSEVAIDVSSQGIGAAMQIECRFQIEPAGDGSRILWTARVAKLSGLISAVSPSLIRSAAEKVIGAGWDGLRTQVEGAAKA